MPQFNLVADTGGARLSSLGFRSGKEGICREKDTNFARMLRGGAI